MSFNYLAMIFASTVSVFLGTLYGFIFRKQAVQLTGSNNGTVPIMTNTRRIRAYGGAIVADFGIAFALSYLIYELGVTTLTQGLMLTFWVFVGFVVPMTIGAVLWEGKSFRFWLFNMVINAICLFVMVMILMVWQ